MRVKVAWKQADYLGTDQVAGAQVIYPIELRQGRCDYQEHAGKPCKCMHARGLPASVATVEGISEVGGTTFYEEGDFGKSVDVALSNPLKNR